MVVKLEFKKKLPVKAGHFTPLTLVLVSSTLVALSPPPFFFFLSSFKSTLDGSLYSALDRPWIPTLQFHCLYC